VEQEGLACQRKPVQNSNRGKDGKEGEKRKYLVSINSLKIEV